MIGKMKTAAVIAEFNPFHNGHAALIRKARELSGADHVLVVMSGDYCQRGEAALVDKFTRTRMALVGGADLVLELPHYYALGSAEYFALGAVSLLAKCGAVDALVFGSECGDIEKLSRLAHILASEPPAFKLHLQRHLKEGADFPTARAKALALCLKEEEKESAKLLETPNNLLGVEYLKQIERQKVKCETLTIKRTPGIDSFSIRNSLLSQQKRIRKAQMPESCAMLLRDYPANTGYEYAVTGALFFALRHVLALESAEGVAKIADVGEDLARKIYKVLPEVTMMQDLVAALHTKDMTQARIRRALMHILLHMPQASYDTFARKKAIYARVLGFKKAASPLMNRIKSDGKLPLITKLSQAPKLLADDKEALRLLGEDIRASFIYDQCFLRPEHYPIKSEYEKQIVTV